MDNLQIEYMPTAELLPYARNARRHSVKQVGQISASILEFGFLNPIIVDKNNTIVAGHGRVMAAQQLALERVPVIRAEHLTDAQRRAYTLVDNQLALNSDWDNDMLKVEIDELKAMEFDLDLLGIPELESILNTPDYSVLGDDDLNQNLDKNKEEVRKAIQIEFDIDSYVIAQELVKFWRERGANIGAMLIEKLEEEKTSL
jgi:hypothetical protein